MEDESKQRIPLWIYPSIVEQVDKIYGDNHCKSRSEFIEQAIKFYLGYLETDNMKNYLPNMLLPSIEGIVETTEYKLSRLLFKQAVEMSMIMNILAGQLNADEQSLIKLRGKCVEDVKRTNGKINFEDIYKYQKGL